MVHRPAPPPPAAYMPLQSRVIGLTRTDGYNVYSLATPGHLSLRTGGGRSAMSTLMMAKAKKGKKAGKKSPAGKDKKSGGATKSAPTPSAAAAPPSSPSAAPAAPPPAATPQPAARAPAIPKEALVDDTGAPDDQVLAKAKEVLDAQRGSLGEVGFGGGKPASYTAADGSLRRCASSLPLYISTVYLSPSLPLYPALCYLCILWCSLPPSPDPPATDPTLSLYLSTSLHASLSSNRSQLLFPFLLVPLPPALPIAPLQTQAENQR